jgi:hypothetical protein
VNGRRCATGAILFSVWLGGCSRIQIRSPIAPADGPPATWVRSTADGRTRRILEVREGLAKADAFKAVSDYLSESYSVDVSDAKAGFLMTPWQASLLRQGVPDLRYRTRVIIRFLGDEWKQISVKSEANWQRGDEWEIGFDTKLLDTVTAEVRSRIGKTP